MFLVVIFIILPWKLWCDVLFRVPSSEYLESPTENVKIKIYNWIIKTSKFDRVIISKY